MALMMQSRKEVNSARLAHMMNHCAAVLSFPTLRRSPVQGGCAKSNVNKRDSRNIQQRGRSKEKR